jgi:chromate reductase
MKIVAISGSLRNGSSNTAALRAAARLAPAAVDVALFEGIAGLPFFNPDLDGAEVPAPVAGFRAIIGSADGLLISSPEYARGVAGVMKNALDWLVASFESGQAGSTDQYVTARHACACRAAVDAGDNVGPDRG